jgi:hypothetical protein
MLMMLVFFVAFFGPAAFAGWPRCVNVAGNEDTDSPPPHPLEYFRTDPCLRPSSDPLVRSLGCDPAPTAEQQKRLRDVRTRLVEVGKTKRFTLYDLWYDRQLAVPSGELSYLKSVLVKSGRDEYHEIDVRTPVDNILPPSETIDTYNGGPLLMVKSNYGGIHSPIVDTPYMFNRDGVVKPNFLAVEKAIQKLTPPGLSILAETNDYASPVCEVTLYRSDRNEPSCCQTVEGKITVYYRFAGNRAVVTGSKYQAQPQ